MYPNFEKNKVIRSFDGSLFLQPLTARPNKIRNIKNKKLMPIIAKGSCTSYVLACCAKESIAMDMTQFNLILGFDESKGIITAQSGILMYSIIEFLQSKGFIFPTVPGNPYATLGGAVAANVHGKNSYKRGVIYNHIISLKLMTSEFKEIECFPGEPLFECTVGGYGITGIILEVKIKCKKANYNGIKLTHYKVNSLKEAGLLLPSLTKHDYLYSTHYSSWPIKNTKGIIIAGDYVFLKNNKKISLKDHLDNQNPDLSNPYLKTKPFSPCLWNSFTINLAQSIFLLKAKLSNNKSISLSKFYFPIENLKLYFHLFGNKGFIENQLLIPIDKWEQFCPYFLKLIEKYKLSTTVLSLKFFSGEDRLISFSGNGLSLTFDIPYSKNAIEFVKILDRFNCNIGVKSNIIKDRRLSADIIMKQYDLEQFLDLISICQNDIYGPDIFKPCKSDLIRRITE